MKIGVLDFSGLSKGSSTTPKEVQYLKDAIEKQKHEPVIYKAEKCLMVFDFKTSGIVYNGKNIDPCDVLIPRFAMTSNVDLEVSILKQFQLMGIPVINGYIPLTRAKNKLRTMQILTRKGIPVPKTIVVRKIKYIDKAIEKVGGYPVILKTPFGSYGAGVVIVESRRSLFSALDVILSSVESNIMLIQEYVAEAEACDYRAFTIGDRVIASMKRKAKTGDFRSNIHLGGEASKVKLTDEEIKMAVKATQALGLKMGGVDILRSKTGPVVMEVNGNPGFYNLMHITGIDVPGEIVKFAVSVAKKRKAAKR
jgi:ribosomal protein S6--L-glutamate ligase